MRGFARTPLTTVARVMYRPGVANALQWAASGAPVKPHVALYGNVGLVRAKCPECHRVALVVHGRFQCCDADYDRVPKDYVRVVSPEFARKGPSVSAKRELLDLQDHSCAWCERRFGSWVTTVRGQRQIAIRWDHVLPHAFSQNNFDSNFVAACQFCNAWKSDLMFSTDTEVRLYVARKWEAFARAKNLPAVSKGV